MQPPEGVTVALALRNRSSSKIGNHGLSARSVSARSLLARTTMFGIPLIEVEGGWAALALTPLVA